MRMLARLLYGFPGGVWLIGWITLAAGGVLAAGAPPGLRLLDDYFKAQTARLATNCLAEFSNLGRWSAAREGLRQEFLDMLGLSPLPERTDLKATVTGRIELEDIVVEKLHFQSLPGLYVTANLYLPRALPKPVPAVLYLCGHSAVVTNGVSCGNKTGYQHHGIWLARNGYACLMLDTIQLGELQGVHHGTYRETMWWWNSRGYTPAGVEAWNGMRALDYLQTRPEVDPGRLGVTGRSGGGAYSWWIAAADDRVKVAAPVAGITDLQNHVVDGVVDGHCDCMFMVNTYRWDYPEVAALVAPRPLLIANTDKDSIFPLDGVVRLHAKVRRVYALCNATDKLGLLIAEGPHRDTQELQLPVLRWFNRHLKGEEPIIETAARKLLSPEQLRVFDTLPADQRTTNIHDSFVPAAKPRPLPTSDQQWDRQRDDWLAALRQKCFAAWPDSPDPIEARLAFSAERARLRLEGWDFASQEPFRLRLYVLCRPGLRKPERVVMRVLDEPGWARWLAGVSQTFDRELAAEREYSSQSGATDSAADFVELASQLTSNHMAMVFFAPRGIGLTSWGVDQRKEAQVRRRFMLLGQTLDGMRCWDIRRAAQAVTTLRRIRGAPIEVQGERFMAANCLYAALFEQTVRRLDLWDMPKSHAEGPDYLNVLRVLDLPQALALASTRMKVCVHGPGWTDSRPTASVGPCLIEDAARGSPGPLQGSAGLLDAGSALPLKAVASATLR